MDGTDNPEPCDCPGCSEETGDVIGTLLSGAAALVDDDDPIAAELTGAMFVAMVGDEPDPDGVRPLRDGLIPQLADRGGPEAVALLTAIAAVSPPPAAKVARAAVTALAGTGVPMPKWADEVAAEVTVDDCWRIDSPDGTDSVFTVAFRRAGRTHAMMVVVDHADCAAAQDILLLDGDQLPAALDELTRDPGTTRTRLDPADLRWHVEQALDARSVHDEADAELDDEPEPDDDEGPPYPVLATLLDARLATMPESDRPPAPHHEAGPDDLADLLPGLPGGGGFPAQHRPGSVRPAPTRKLPAKRKKSQGPAPAYRVDVVLAGSEPPVRRQLEVVGDTPLEDLHHVIQSAFDWDDSHLHLFETPYGEFAPPGDRTGRQSERKVTLEQVAPAVGDMITYRYDFGDDWTHEITVVAVTDRDPTAVYPRCTGGERAAPPEDCGGVWGYAHLLDVLADPSHPEYADRRDWLGLDDGQAPLDPGRFDPDVIERRLAALR
ncbi:plasmid pRiA4b ORF-3 family protein [Solwaraspora sp. WMMB762]|uniref:plasmid pRiA4b ORF-3 family protein n=1 Tax=Solwaraspora sp. WMMB762 TaxID=3404120 RepID=UPI003B945641